MHVVTTVVVIAAETMVIVATVIATKTSRTTVGAFTIAVVTVVEIIAPTFTAATVAAFNGWLLEQVDRCVVDEIVFHQRLAGGAALL